MRAIDAINAEHDLVAVLLECLEALLRAARARGRLDEAAARELLSLFEEFVDGSHQVKEERLLFPALLARATPREAARLARLFDEHAAERRRLVGMLLHLAGAAGGREASLERFLANGLLYLRLQRRHLSEESLYVVPLAEILLTREDDVRLLGGFRGVDARAGSPHDVERRVGALRTRLAASPAGRASSH